MKWFLAVLALAIFLVSCSGEKGADQPPQATDNQVNTPTLSDDASDEFESLFAKQEKAEWMITYNLKYSGSGTGAESQMSQYIKGDRMRTDLAFEGIEMRTIALPDEYINCQKQSTWTCTKVGAVNETGENDAEQIESDYETDPTKYDVTKDGTKQVAGVTAQCFKVQETGSTFYARYCVSKEGAPLYMYATSADGTSEMEATQYSTDVADSAFTPPAEPTDMPTYNTVPADGEYNPGDFDPCSACEYLTGDDRAECMASCS
jgi:hypothetical protein